MFPKLALVAMKTYFSVLANVVRPSQIAVDQHVQTVLQEHDVGGFLGDVHRRIDRDPHVRGVQGRRIVDAVPQIAHDPTGFTQRQDQVLLLVRLDLGEDVDVRHAPPQRFRAHPPQFLSAQEPVPRQAHLGGDMGGDETVVTGDHLQRHSQPPQLVDRRPNSGFGGIAKHQVSDQGHLALGLFAGSRRRSQVASRHAEQAEAFSLQRRMLALEVVANCGQRHRRSVGADGRGADGQYIVERALRDQPMRSLMRHQNARVASAENRTAPHRP